MKAENYQDYLSLFKESLQQAIDSTEDQESKKVLQEIDPLTENEWKEAMELGLFDHQLDDEAIKKLYEEIEKLYPEAEEDEE